MNRALRAGMDEIVDNARAEAGGAGAEEIAELGSKAGGVDVAAGGVAAKDPVAVGVCCGEAVGGGGMELSERFLEGLR